MRPQLFIGIFFLFANCSSNENNEQVRNIKIVSDSITKYSYKTCYWSKRKSEVLLQQDTLFISYFSDSTDTHVNYVSALFEYNTFRLYDVLSKFSTIKYQLINPYKNKIILLSKTYDQFGLDTTKSKYENKIYKDFLTYLVDSMIYYDVDTYNFMLKNALPKNNPLYNKDFIIILDGFLQDCAGAIKDDEYKNVMVFLGDIYTDPGFKSAPELERHLQYFLNYCSDKKTVTAANIKIPL